ncbi:mechanosensitive ion channel [Anaerolineales bacterium HSG25]|nr:mechanosensitive ion channel [Anaerolineales bacterium HSG25]
MSDYNDFNVLLDPFLKIMLYLGRAAVQRQLVTIAVILVAAGFISQAIGVGIKRFVVPRIERSLAGRLQAFLKHGLLIITDIAFPVMCLYATDYARNQFIADGELYGLLDNLYFLLWVLFIYRLCISLAYQILGTKTSRFHYRLIGPLFALYIFGYALLDLVDFYQLANFELLKFSEEDVPLTLGALFLATVGLYFWIDLILGVEHIIQGSGEKYTTFESGTIAAILTPVRYILISMGIIFAFGNLGLDEDTMTVITGGLSVGIGFGMQEVLSNFISGLLLMFEQSVRPGDVISVDGQMGRVTKMNIRAATVQTLDDVDLIIPNQQLFTSTVTAYTQSSKMVRFLVSLEVSEDTAGLDYMKYCIGLAEQHPLVMSEPGPNILATGFGDSSVTYQLEGWVVDPMKMEDVVSDLNKAIWAGYDEHGFSNSTPERNLNVLSVP